MDWRTRLISDVVEVICGVGTVAGLVLANTASNVPPEWVAVANVGFAVFFGVWVLTRTMPQQDKRHQSTIQAMLKTFATEAKADRDVHAATVEKIERRHDEQMGQLYDRLDRQSTQFVDALDRLGDQLAQSRRT